MNLRIRNATMKDIEGIADCAERFFEYAKYEEVYGMPLDRESFKGMVKKYIKEHICILTVDGETVKGGICGMVVPWGFNANIKIGFELFYWMDEDVRGTTAIRMFNEYEKRVKEQGAFNIMIQPETVLSDKVGKLYERRGYKPLERFWIKCLSGTP